MMEPRSGSPGDEAYRRLRGEIDRRMPLGFPASPEGSEIELLKNLFTPEEAAVASHLSILSEPVARIHRRVTRAGLAISREQLGAMLSGLARRGAISGSALAAKRPRYGLAQFAIGIFEYQVDRLTAETARLYRDYMRGPFREEFAREDRPRQMRTVPVEQSVAAGRSTPSYDSIRGIVKDLPEPLAVMHCVCRQSKDLLGEPCGRSPIRECCMVFGSAAESVLQKGIPSARRITRDELTGLLDLFQGAGFVLQAENARRPIFLCACCPCCCDALAGYRLFPRPSDIVASSFVAGTDAARCTGCGICVKRCPMGAVVVYGGTAQVDMGRCIGCGVCAASCNTGAIALNKKDRAAVPPATHDALYRTILLKKVGMAGFLKLLLRLVARRKV